MRRKHLLIGASVLALGAAAGGGAIAVAGSGDDQTLGGSTADKARAAASKYTGGGKASVVEDERSDAEEHGATYGVEVTKPDGHKVDVFLDADYKLLRITSNEDG